MSSHAPPLSELIGRVYEAAAGSACWSDLIADVAHAAGANSGIFHDVDGRTGLARTIGGYNLDPALLGDYERYYSRFDIWHRRLRTWPVGLVNGTHQLYTDTDLLRSEFYNDHLRHARIFYACGAVIDRSPEGMAVFGVQRDRRRGPFGVSAGDPVAALAPHLRRALMIRRRLASVESTRDIFAALLDGSTSGAVLLDADGRILFANRIAADLLARRDGLVVRNGVLAALRSADAGRFAGAVRRAAGAAGATPIGDLLVLPRAGAPPLSLVVVPLCPDGFRRMVGLFIDVPDEPRPLETVARRCGLTPAETRLFVGLAAGRSLNEIADRHGVSVNTLRIQLRSVFDKTGTRRQAELVHFALSQDARSRQRARAASRASAK